MSKAFTRETEGEDDDIATDADDSDGTTFQEDAHE